MATQALTAQQLQTLMQQYDNFIRPRTTMLNAGDATIASGTIFYNNANALIQWPTTWAAYQAYMQQLNAACTAFKAAMPVEPTLQG